MSDRLYLRILYFLKTGQSLNLRNPEGYREKIQWLKLYNRSPRYTVLVDKHLVKDVVARTIGADHIIPTIAVWDDPDQVDFDVLPDQFVIKCNHNSHLGLCICSDKNTFDTKRARKRLWEGYQDNYYKRSREWAYKNVPRKIIAEHFLCDGTGMENSGVLTDYKWFCFNGRAKMMYVSQDIAEDPRTDFFDMDFNRLPLQMQDKGADETPQKPAFFEEMRVAAEKLSEGIPFVRVDFYVANGNYWFGEMTFYPSSGLAPIRPAEWDGIIGSWIQLPDKKLK